MCETPYIVTQLTAWCYKQSPSCPRHCSYDHSLQALLHGLTIKPQLVNSHNYEVLREVPAPRVLDPPDEGLKEVHETLQGGEWMAVNKAIM